MSSKKLAIEYGGYSAPEGSKPWAKPGDQILPSFLVTKLNPPQEKPARTSPKKKK
jgi:hypothetical protein